MGYTTRYTLVSCIDSEEASEWGIRPTFREALGPLVGCFSGSPLKWRTFDADIRRAISESRAEVVIQGVGEDDSDTWIHEWKLDEDGIPRFYEVDPAATGRAGRKSQTKEPGK